MIHTQASRKRDHPVHYGYGTRNIKLWYFVGAIIFVISCFTASVLVKTFRGVHPIAEMSAASLPQEEAAVPGTSDVSAAGPEMNGDKLATALSGWISKKPGSYGVVIADEQGNVLASNQADKTFFAASLYKIYVAYEGYQLIDNGTNDKQQVYLNGKTRGQCLDEMIRNSDSPCAEKLMAEIGKDTITAKLAKYGLTHTSLRSLTTSAGDIAIVLSRLQQQKDLSPASTQAMFDSMLGQKYRNGLPAGFSPQKVYNKVGFRDTTEYHDVGIVELEDGRRVIMSVLTENAGVNSIKSLASAILEASK